VNRPCLVCSIPTPSTYCTQHRAKSGWAARPSRVGADTYRGDWPKIRATQLRQHSTCRYCGARASEVNHVVALADGGSHDPSNLESVCHSCHQRITSQQNRARRKRVAG